MTIIKQKEQRIGLFIDAQNLYHSANRIYNANVNFKNLLPEVIAGRKLIRSIAYVITTDTGEENPFFEALEKVGVETKTKDLQVFYGGVKKADWDVGLAVDAIRLAPKLDAIVIFSGDGDYVPLVEYLKLNAGCQVEIVSIGKTTSQRLVEVADDFFDISSNSKKFLIKKRKNYKESKRKGSIVAQTKTKETGVVKNKSSDKKSKKQTKKNNNEKPINIGADIVRVSKNDIIVDGKKK